MQVLKWYQWIFKDKVKQITKILYASYRFRCTFVFTIFIEAKKKARLAKHPPTGGGKKDDDPTQAEEAVIASLEGRPSLDGLDGAIESYPDDEVNLTLTTGNQCTLKMSPGTEQQNVVMIT